MDEYGDCDVAKQSTYLLMTSRNVTELSNKNLA